MRHTEAQQSHTESGSIRNRTQGCRIPIPGPNHVLPMDHAPYGPHLGQERGIIIITVIIIMIIIIAANTCRV